MGLISALRLWGNSSGSPGVVAVAGERSWALAEWGLFAFILLVVKNKKGRKK